jgi:hypothetical protein
MVAVPLILLHRAKKKVEYTAATNNEGCVSWMGKRSSYESKLRKQERRQIRNILLTYSFKDHLLSETVYTPENETLVMAQLKDKLGFTQHLAEYGEVLISPLGESPTTVNLLIEDAS